MSLEEQPNNQRLDTAGYHQIVKEAYDRVATDGFSATQYIAEKLSNWKDNFEEMSIDHKTRMQLEVSETLGNAVNNVDLLRSTQEYETLKVDLQNMSSEERAFARSCIKSSELTLKRLDTDELPVATGAQLMAILA